MLVPPFFIATKVSQHPNNILSPNPARITIELTGKMLWKTSIVVIWGNIVGTDEPSTKNSGLDQRILTYLMR